MDTEDRVRLIFQARAVEAREIPDKVTNDEIEKLPICHQPFLYASGNFGPGYVSIKSLVAVEQIIQQLIEDLAAKIVNRGISPDFVAGNVTGGLIPGWILSEKLGVMLKKNIRYIYVSGTRKESDNNFPFTFVYRNVLDKVAHDLKQMIAGLSDYSHSSFVAGMTPGGMVLGYRLSQLLKLPFVYVRESRKKGGQKELITGKHHLTPGSTGIVVGQVNNFLKSCDDGCATLVEEGFCGLNLGAALLREGDGLIDGIENIELPYKGYCHAVPEEMEGIVVEELVNFAQTTTNSAVLLRQAGYKIKAAATVLYYDHQEANQTLKDKGLDMVYLLTLPDVLEAGPRAGSSVKAIEDWKDFLKNPYGWQRSRGLEPIKKGGTL